MDLHGCECKDTVITEGMFGEIWPDSIGDQIGNDQVPKIIKSYTMVNSKHTEVTIITWGATIVSIKCPDKYGCVTDVVLGFDDLKEYTNPMINPYIGCVLGRCTNRIKDGMITIRGKDYLLSKNDFNGKHHLHGGTNGFGRHIWQSYIAGCSVIMSYLSQDGEEGYPGAVLATIRFKLTPDNKLELCMRATTSKPTVLNLSHGSLFNLAGHETGEVELKKHKVLLNCDRWTFADYTDPVPTGAIRGVGGTCMDLRIPRILGEYMEKVPPGEGYDHNFCITKSWNSDNLFAAKIWHPKSGRVLEVYTNQPGVHFYTGGRLPPPMIPNSIPSFDWLLQDDDDAKEFNGSNWSDTDDEKDTKRKNSPKKIMAKSRPLDYITGKKGAHYKKHCAFSIQPQNYPNAINYAHFPCAILYPGQVYRHDLSYKFGIQLSSFM